MNYIQKEKKNMGKIKVIGVKIIIFGITRIFHTQSIQYNNNVREIKESLVVYIYNIHKIIIIS